MAMQHVLGGAGDSPTILVEGTLRSGQSVNFEGNVVVLGDINPGAQVTAGGNVIVMGVLRGMVHAGAAGDAQAVIVAFRLRPTQLRIANHISRSPDGEVCNPNQPEIARVREGIVVIEAFPPGGERQGKKQRPREELKK
ncbi:MAG: septum site-determining protein MinC [Candidatus Desulforudis sp.]|nr:septum site-determining protein MinC [Desulforudis sp.]